MADTYDLLTPVEADEAVNHTVGTTNNDEELQRMVTAVSRVVDDMCGPVVQRTVTDERHPGGRAVLFLRQPPAASVSTVVAWQSGTSTALTAETDSTAGTFLFDNTLEWAPRLYRRSGFSTIRWPAGHVYVTYTSGRVASTGTVDPKFKEAAAAILRRLRVREAGAWARPDDPFATATPAFFQAVKPMVDELLHDETRLVAQA